VRPLPVKSNKMSDRQEDDLVSLTGPGKVILSGLLQIVYLNRATVKTCKVNSVYIYENVSVTGVLQ
jgi:hypothetical protein